MKYLTEFSVGLTKGEFDRLLDYAFNYIKKRRYNKALSLLLPLYHYCTHEPVGDKVAYYIAYALEKTGDKKNASYYYNKVYHFYPQSRYRRLIRHPYITDQHFKIDNYGKPIDPIYIKTEKELLNPDKKK